MLLLPLWKHRREAESKTLRKFTNVLPWVNLTISSFKGFRICKLAQVRKLVHRLRFPLTWYHKITLPVLSIAGQAIIDIDLSILPKKITLIILPLAVEWYLQVPASSGPIKPVACDPPHWGPVSLILRSATRKSTREKLFKCVGTPLLFYILKD